MQINRTCCLHLHTPLPPSCIRFSCADDQLVWLVGLAVQGTVRARVCLVCCQTCFSMPPSQLMWETIAPPPVVPDTSLKLILCLAWSVSFCDACKYHCVISITSITVPLSSLPSTDTSTGGENTPTTQNEQVEGPSLATIPSNHSHNSCLCICIRDYIPAAVPIPTPHTPLTDMLGP